MSWVQWRGEVWPATEKEAELHLHLWPRESACPRQSWSWDLHHYPHEFEENGERKLKRWAGIDLLDLNLQVDNWRDLADREIRADAAWHDQHEHTDEHGNLNIAAATLILADLNPARRLPNEKPHQHWVGHDFVVRLGAREGFIIPVEFEGEMILEEEYYRLEPETEDEVAAFAEGSFNLRAMARTRFNRCSVVVERCEDPAPRAREYLREAIGLQLPSNAVTTVGWNSYRKLPDGKSEPRPGWTSVVTFDLPNE